ncbi:MAG: DinB family protein [Pirellulales bacterium]
MSRQTVEILTASFAFCRERTYATVDRLDEMAHAVRALSWRPGPGRAHVAWQLMHIAVTEDIFASERLAPEKPGLFTDLWPRFRGGSTPDDVIPSLEDIRSTLDRSRQSLLETLAEYDDARLDEIPPPLAQRGLTVRRVLELIAWHESHHQGQAHLTLNLYAAIHP